MIASFVHKATTEDIQCQTFRQIIMKIQLLYLLRTSEIPLPALARHKFLWKTPEYCSYLPIFGNTD
jgi:hypothetical protein